MRPSEFGYIFVMFAVTYAIRVLPITLLRRPITNRFIRSFLYYVPYVTLALMTFPAILDATSSPVFGLVAFIVGILIAWFNGNLFLTEICCCLIVLLLSFFG